MIAACGIERVVPGAMPPDLWALRPERLSFRGVDYALERQPALIARTPDAAAWLALEGEDLVLLGPYGDAGAFEAVVEEAQAVARGTGRARLLVSARNDEIDRFAVLQRLGFRVIEARLGAFAPEAGHDDDRCRTWGDIAARDEFVLETAVGRP